MGTQFNASDFNKLARPLETVQIHCSANSSAEWDNVDVIKDLHVNKNGWSDIGYNFYITFDGRIWSGRPVEKIPAGIRGHNSRSLAICCSGLKESDFTDAQMSSLKELCARINTVYEGQVTFHGHREFANKLCPVFDYKRVLDLDASGRMLENGSKPLRDYSHFPSVKQGDTGDVVFILQRLLDMKVADGIYGPATAAAVRAFQSDIGLSADGVAGPVTWAELI